MIGQAGAANTKAPDHKHPPGPSGNPVFGIALHFRRDPLGCLHSLMPYGGITRYHFMLGIHGYFLSHPDYIKHVLQDNNQNYSKRTLTFNLLKLLVGNGLLTSEGDFWRRQRRLAQPAFHRQRLASFGSMMTDSTLAMLERWESRAGGPLDLDREMMALTLQIVGKALFSIDLSGDSKTVGEAFTEANRYIGDQSVNPFAVPYARIPTPGNRRFHRSVRMLDGVVNKIIDERRRNDEDRSDLLSMLMLARDEETGERMDNRQLRDEVMTLLLAGHETTANALTWTWYLLSKHPDAAQKLRAELDLVLRGRTPTMDDLPNLNYTRMVIEETLRLYPPAWGVTRMAINDDEIGGYRLPARSVVGFSMYSMHRHPDYWENPEQFDPERFTPERSANRPRYAYFPFGGGPRQCIGNSFAMTEAQLILATVAQRFRLELVPGFRVEPQALVTLRPRYGMTMTMHTL